MNRDLVVVPGEHQGYVIRSLTVFTVVNISEEREQKKSDFNDLKVSPD